MITHNIPDICKNNVVTKIYNLKTLIVIPIVLLTITISGCSDTQNLKDKKVNNEIKTSNSVTIEFGEKTTTENGVTKTDIDQATFAKYSKALSNVFSKGTQSPKLFLPTILEEAKPVFEISKNASNEKVSVDLNILKSATPTDNLAVAHIKQYKTVSGKTLERDGVIYLDNSGIVTGFDLPEFADPSTTTTIQNS